MQVKLMTAEVNGARIAFSSETVFLVQVSRSTNRKSSFKTVAKFKGAEFGKMATYFQGISIHSGHRKRIVMVGSSKNNGVIIKQRS